MARESRQEEVRRERKERVPLGVARKKLEVQDIPDGFVGRWVNDTGNRLNEAMEGGYTFLHKGDVGKVGDAGASDITQREGLDSRISRVVGENADGTPLTAYLMAIKQEWYDEDQRAKQKTIDEHETAMRRGSDQYGQPGQDRRYVVDGTKIEHKRA